MTPGDLPARGTPGEGITPRQDPAPERAPRSPFPIVGVGASAGGLDAVTELLAHLPESPGMAFVIVQHLDPHYDSHLVELLSRATRMPVLEAAPGVAVEPDHVYVITPNTSLTIEGGALRVTSRGDARPHLPVDLFMRALAAEQQTRAIGVVLSGSGSDGTLGLAEIKAVGGITFAQDERTAKQFNMPRSAVDAGCVDFVLPPAEIARRLEDVAKHPYLAPERPAGGDEGIPEDQFQKIVRAVRAATGVDFSQYRDSTLRRRIGRRMALHGQHEMGQYVRVLESSRAEVDALYRDLLINVTSFFRDAEMFEELKRQVFPRILEGKGREDAIRIWVAGCSTGQEAYSLALALVEFLDDKPLRPRIQLFATDLSDAATLEKARAGVYPESIEGEMTPERLRRFFLREDHVYRVDKTIRDMCVFARQNLVTDPPFSHVDLISCRNVLMYMGVGLQKQVVPTFHYALNPRGFLVLGPSETVGDGWDLFEPVDRAHKIYAKKLVAIAPAFRFPAAEHHDPRPGAGRFARRPGTSPADFEKEADRILLGHYAPPGVLVNDRFDILQFRGRTADFLESPAGEPTLNVLKMARENLFLELRIALNEAVTRGEPVLRKVTVRGGEGFRSVNLRVTPVKPGGATASCFLVLFEDPEAGRHPPEGAGEGGRGEEPSTFRRWLRRGDRALPAEAGPHAPDDLHAVAREEEMLRLRQELAATREYLQSAVEQQEASNEELRSANEEILSSNEELQSTNEELQTAKEELQSANEELTTVNEQLQSRNSELTQVTNDLANLLTSTSIPMVMVGADLRVRRLTPAAQKVLNLLPSDVGRPIAHIRPAVEVPALEELVEGVIEQVRVWKTEVQDRDGRWWQLRIHPYRTSNHTVDGAVIILVDVDDIKRVAERLGSALQVGQLGAWEVDLSDGTMQCSDECKASYGVDGDGAFTYDDLFRAVHPEDQDRVRREMNDAVDRREDYSTEYRVTWPDGSEHWISARARATYDPRHQPIRITGLTLDVTERKKMEDELRLAARRKDQFLATLSHELRNPLAPMRYALRMLGERGGDGESRLHALDVLDRQLQHLVRIVDDLLDVSRITHGTIELRRDRVDLDGVIQTAVETCRSAIEAAGHELIVQSPGPAVVFTGDHERLSQVIADLLHNAAKFTPRGGRIWLIGERAAGDAGRRPEVVIRVRDTGVGIDTDFLPLVFDVFAQANQPFGRSSGLGVGLSLVKQLIELHGGTVEAFSRGPGTGAEFVVRLPLLDEGEAPAPVPSPAGETRAGSPGRLRIVVAEDNVDSAAMLEELLGAIGHDVRTVHDGPRAIDAVAAFRPDVVLLDIGLPGMSGYEVAQRLRAEAGGKDLLLVALTGWGQEEDRQKSAHAGIDHHLVKPVAPQALEALLASVRPRAFPTPADE
jgi:two-component system CheB/CheR fusion protein